MVCSCVLLVSVVLYMYFRAHGLCEIEKSHSSKTNINLLHITEGKTGAVSVTRCMFLFCLNVVKVQIHFCITLCFNL